MEFFTEFHGIYMEFLNSTGFHINI
jgi:hypothetical protein